MKNRVCPVSLPLTIFMPAARSFRALLAPIVLRFWRARSTDCGVILASWSPTCAWICAGEMVSRSSGSFQSSRLAAPVPAPGLNHMFGRSFLAIRSLMIPISSSSGTSPMRTGRCSQPSTPARISSLAFASVMLWAATGMLSLCASSTIARNNGGVSVLSVPFLIVHPDLDELRLHARVVLHRRASLFDRRHLIRHVGSGRVALGPGARVGNPRSRGAKQRRAGDDLFPHPQRHVAPAGPAAVQVRPVHQVADADDGAEPVVGEALQMVDEILAREVLLGHRPVHIVLVSDVAVEIDLGGHDGLARQVDARALRPEPAGHPAGRRA